MINWYATFQDFLILHEYAHFLEAQISKYAPLNFAHDGCTATSGGTIVNSPEHAWMEGSPPGASVTTPAVTRDAAGRLAVFTANTSDGTIYVKSQTAPNSSTSYQ